MFLFVEWEQVLEVCEGSFKGCSSLHRVTFGPSSSLERIGVSCFEESGVEEDVFVPDGVRELCEGCFKECKSPGRVVMPPSVKHQLSVPIHIKPLMGPALKLSVQLTETIEVLKTRRSMAFSQTGSV